MSQKKEDPIKLSLERRIELVKQFFAWTWQTDIGAPDETEAIKVEAKANEDGTWFEVNCETTYHGQQMEHLELDGDYLVGNFQQRAVNELSAELFVADSICPEDLMRARIVRLERERNEKK